MAELSSDSKSDDKSENDIKGVNISNGKSESINDNKSDNISDGKSDSVNDNKNVNINVDEKEIIRRHFYKNRIRKDNIKLELDDSTPQEERRRLLLEHQKKFRDATFNASRGISQECSENEEYVMDAEEYTAEEYMDVEEYKKDMEDMYMRENFASSYYRITSHDSRSNRMMLSEWMMDVPQDFTENWIMVPCPIGKRVRLISGWGETRAYSRKGALHGVFPSALPGGNPDSDLHNSAALDCIWIKEKKLFYILDVLYWSQLPFTNCEVECRFFWIKCKFQEIPELKERGTDTNRYPILPPQKIDCNSDLYTALTNLNIEHPLDGFLFYHRQALYTYGQTPLVTWLKPFMLSEVLGIAVPSSWLDEKPNDYINFEHHVQKVKRKKNQYTTNIVTNSMEIEGVV